MFKIIKKENLNNDIVRITVEAAFIAQKAQAGQFVVIIIDERGERLPLTLADWDKEVGTITLIFQKAGFTTRRLAKLEAGQEIQHILGPLGHPTEVKNLGQVYCVAGGVGAAEIYPVARAFKQAGNRVICIIGSRNKDLLILEDILRGSCDEFFITTDDGSYGRQGLVTDVLKDLFTVIEKSAHTQYPGLVYCIGPVPMMRAVADFTRGYSVKTIASLNPIMVDATGMCGACRCHVAGKTAFACVDGPDFDAHQVDFGELSQRLKTFKQEERRISEENA
ncbi:MAG: sulfide/dihydroorotate dehydrogenase-like FAD/NAD-binding protein [Candidatus Omnitrophica bacterium]|nr:sulfide/dihydroorotate dehydrogenase-like FAD/NAD-binding protein [Candidatus Omnitrophota bacterium]MDD5519055.1 sulfide/dihydroorotate dehydrogenase-like FAD/NAD-binding protein [Candidatus Omnitrophota bacterium]